MKLSRVIFFLLLLFQTAWAVPVVLYDSTPGMNSKGGPLVAGPSSFLGTTRDVALGFQTGASALLFSSAELHIGLIVGSPADLVIELRSEASSLPDNVLATLNTSTLIPFLSSVTPSTVFTSAGSVVLNANTGYWITARATNSSAFGWHASVPSGPGAFERTGGGAWTALSGGPVSLKVTADSISSVPEIHAGTMALPFVLMACVFLVLTDRRRTASVGAQEATPR